MPAKSAKQYRLMQAATHGKLKSTGGLDEKVARKFIDSTPSGLRSKWSKKKKS